MIKIFIDLLNTIGIFSIGVVIGGITQYKYDWLDKIISWIHLIIHREEC